MVPPRRLVIGASCAMGALTACSGAPPSPPRPVEIVPSKPLPLPAPVAARWVEGGGATLVGPAVPGGTLVLLGGRRAIVHPDGSLENETSPSPEPLLEIVEVPGEQRRLIARSEHLIVRIDAPLGPLTPLASTTAPLDRIGALPGLIAAWSARASHPVFLDAERGTGAPSPALPNLPMRSVAFLDAKRGAAVFEGAGLAVTSDGGATWRLAGDTTASEALRARGVHVRAGELRAFTWEDGPEAAVDVAAAKVGRLTFFEGASENPMLQWIRAAGEDPLAAVAASGVDLQDGRALVTSHGLLARVDPRTGAIDAVTDIGQGKGVGFCGSGRAGQSAWVACSVDDRRGDLFDPFGVMRVPLDEPFRKGRPELVRNGGAELRVSPSGGVMLLAACGNDEVGAACVRQPDGKWATIPFDTELAERGAAPLADGRIAFLRGLYAGDDAPSSGSDAGAALSAPRRLHVALIGPSGREEALAPIPLALSRGHVVVESPIEEDTDHTLRLVVEDGEAPIAVVVHPTADAVEARPLEGAVAARLRGGHGIAVGAGRIQGSLDGGSTWNPIAGPPRADATVAAASAGDLYVSEMGAVVGRMIRLGWGPSADADGPPEVAPVTAPRVADPPRADGLSRSKQLEVLTCVSQGPSTATPPLASAGEVRQLLDPARSRGSQRRYTALWSSSRAGMLDGAVLLEEEGPDAHAAAPATWTLRWHDPRDIGGRPRRVVLPAPRGTAWGTSLRFAAADGGRALVAVRSGAKVILVRVRATGAVDVAEVASDVVPIGDVTFGEGRGDAIAWARESLVLVWLPGERPRAVARVATTEERWIGAPSASGVPLLLSGSDWAALRVLPIPPVEHGASGPAQGPGSVDPPPAPPSLDGWTRLPRGALDLPTRPACTVKSAAGTRFVVTKRAGEAGFADIDGVGTGAPAGVVYDVRVRGEEVCVAGVAASFTPKRGGSAKGPPPPGFVRADLVGKRAEGGDRGLPPVSVRRMRCDLAKASP